MHVDAISLMYCIKPARIHVDVITLRVYIYVIIQSSPLGYKVDIITQSSPLAIGSMLMFIV